MAFTFEGGVHPPDNKSFSKDKKIEDLPVPESVVIPLQQHIGAPAEPIVEKGDTVGTGQMIGKPTGFVSVPAHASISGTVTAVEDRLTPFGFKSMCLVIEGDGKDRKADGYDKGCPDWENLSTEDIRNIIRDAGITGMGGAAFPTHVKVSPPPEKPIDTVILNGVECEPYATCDHRLMLERTDDVITGFRILMKILDAKKGIIGIEKNKPDAIKLMSEKIKNLEGVNVRGLKVKYPQGGEKQLIYAATKRKVPTGGLPMDCGCLVQNVGTAAAIYDAVVRGRPLIERIVTVTGSGVKDCANLNVRIGTSFQDVIDYCGGLTGEGGKIIMGGPMMGLAQYSTEIPVIKGTSGILCFTADEAKKEEPKYCLSCGRCVDVCPMKLMPRTLAKLVENELWEETSLYGILNCIECGCCVYVCPAKLPLVHLLKFGKSQLQALKKKEK